MSIYAYCWLHWKVKKQPIMIAFSCVHQFTFLDSGFSKIFKKMGKKSQEMCLYHFLESWKLAFVNDTSTKLRHIYNEPKKIKGLNLPPKPNWYKHFETCVMNCDVGCKLNLDEIYTKSRCYITYSQIYSNSKIVVQICTLKKNGEIDLTILFIMKYCELHDRVHLLTTYETIILKCSSLKSCNHNSLDFFSITR